MFEISKNIEIFVNVFKELNKNYVDEIDPAELMRIGIDAMVSSLDPFTNYISESQVERYRISDDERFQGIGASVVVLDEKAMVTDLTPDELLRQTPLFRSLERKVQDQVSLRADFRSFKVVWTREEDMQHSTFRPSHYNRLSATLDAQGHPVAWHHRVTGSSVIARYSPAAFRNNVDPDAIRDAAGPYEFANMLIQYVRQEPPEGLLTGWWRGVGHMQNAFPVECFMDELARASGRDAIAFRKPLLTKQPRALRVLEVAAEKSGWGVPLARGRGRGLALTYSFQTYAARTYLGRTCRAQT